MPEGDTIYRAARALEKALGGRVVTAFETGLAPLARVDDDARIAGRTVDRVEARGKWCLIYFSGRPEWGTSQLTPQNRDVGHPGSGGPIILVTHMLMSGSWHIYRTGEKWWMPRSKMRVAITCGEMQAVAFNVPIAEFHTEHSLARSSQVPKLGPDVLSEGFTVEAGIAAITKQAQQHPEAEVGVTLLNQRVMAGLGNVYKSEVAFAAGVHPFRRMSTVTAREIERMVEASARYMRANVAGDSGSGATGAIVTYAGKRRTTHAMNSGDRLWVYGREGEECRRCGAMVLRRMQGTQVRSTYWCPQCQPWIAAEGQSNEAPEGRAMKRTGPGRRKISC
ncbi:DNA-(apurinic or apyrimidinic site) lyase /endonuclease VIII [Bryocella elongata]|uniref:DNA-(apurinic or apyrimidinic site) lyase n=1 Tax=Bryocella elongata TaxID=863522 RepID=A0A1H6B2X0_9BACT|nr:DNA-formamidopyrimidine glycosylase family protein [Bryocella elongata]SEG54894.1 DNA-(apurinic or apyrimidinic site) lyase /endonuclease VIII [Bryocella elongata]